MHGKLITDNVLVAFETMHHISQKKKGKVGEVSLKLDMSKAYDRVEWIWLEKIMEKMGFNVTWRSLMKQCISMDTYSLKINGVPSGSITPTRGLRLGDLLSPYLFLICVEGLSTLIKKSVENGVLHGVATCKSGPSISQLIFANDSLIFCRASKEEFESLQRIIGVYEKASGQL